MVVLACDEKYLQHVARFALSAKSAQGGMYPLVKKELPYIDGNGIVQTVISGPMFSDDGIFDSGLRSILREMLVLDAKPEARGHFIQIDTGGGTLSAGELAYDTVASLTKPSVAHTSYACSAGIMAIATCTNIYISASGTSQMGSVGVLESWPKWFVDYYNQMYVDIYADTSKRKREEFKSLIAGDVSLTKEKLNEIDNAFMKLVKKHRPDVTSDALTGATFTGRKAIQAGLADAQGTISQATKRLETLIRQNN